MIVKDLLLGRRGNVVTIEPTAVLAAAVKLLAERRIGAVVILGADHRIVGILSRYCARARRAWADSTAQDGRSVHDASIGDVVKNRVEEIEREAAALRDYIQHS